MRLCIAEANTCLEQKVQDRTYWLQKANEKLESLDKMKDEFIRIASHEIRTPIQPIMMFSDLALRGNIDPTTALKGISVEARRLKALADNILDVSKIEGNKVVLDLRDTNLNQLVDSVAGSFRISNSMKENVKLELQLGRFGYHGNTNDVQCFADSDRLRQILSNIIGNAVKFTMHGTVKVRTSFSKDYCRFVIDVIDSGPGIHPDMIPRLFEKFTTRDVAGLNKNGTGLNIEVWSAARRDPELKRRASALHSDAHKLVHEHIVQGLGITNGDTQRGEALSTLILAVLNGLSVTEYLEGDEAKSKHAYEVFVSLLNQSRNES